MWYSAQTQSSCQDFSAKHGQNPHCGSRSFNIIWRHYGNTLGGLLNTQAFHRTCPVSSFFFHRPTPFGVLAGIRVNSASLSLHRFINITLCHQTYEAPHSQSNNLRHGVKMITWLTGKMSCRSTKCWFFYKLHEMRRVSESRRALERREEALPYRFPTT